MKHRRKSRIRLIARILRWLDRRQAQGSARTISRREWKMYLGNAAYREGCYWQRNCWNG